MPSPPPPTTLPQTAPQTDIEIDNEEPYHSSSDEDFDPEAAANKDPPISDSSDDNADGDGDRNGTDRRKRAKRRQATADGNDDGFGELHSGDEATVRRGRKRRRKGKGTGEGADAGTADGEDDEDDEGGEGGLVKTRAQRAREGKERKTLASTESATVDVDALWRDMTSARGKDTSTKKHAVGTGQDAHSLKAVVQEKENGTLVGSDIQPGTTHPTPAPKSNAPAAEEMITIKRTYVFAGETITEEKQVPKTSAEARLHLQSQQAANGSPSAAPVMKPPLRRPKKRASMFEPNPEGTVKGLTPTAASANRGPKLNTIEKSKLDWAGFVDKEGIQEELDGAGKAKEGYLGRMDFLGRVEAKREDEVKAAKKK